MTINDEFYNWESLSDMLLGKDRKTPAELESTLEKDGWFYFNARGRILPLDSVGHERALKLLAEYFKQDEESKTYPYDKQPPSDWLNTDSDPGLSGFRRKPNYSSKNKYKNSLNSNLQIIPGRIPRVAIGKLVVEIAWQLEQKLGARASAKEVMEELQKNADDGIYPDVLKKSKRENKEVVWMTTKSREKSYGIEACEKALSKWNKSRP